MQQNESGKRQLVSSKSNKGEILLDENLPKSLWKALQAAGYPTARFLDEGLRGKPDSIIFLQFRFRSIIFPRNKSYLKTALFTFPLSDIISVHFPYHSSPSTLPQSLLNSSP